MRKMLVLCTRGEYPSAGLKDAIFAGSVVAALPASLPDFFEIVEFVVSKGVDPETFKGSSIPYDGVLWCWKDITPVKPTRHIMRRLKNKLRKSK